MTEILARTLLWLRIPTKFHQSPILRRISTAGTIWRNLNGSPSTNNTYCFNIPCPANWLVPLTPDPLIRILIYGTRTAASAFPSAKQSRHPYLKFPDLPSSSSVLRNSASQGGKLPWYPRRKNQPTKRRQLITSPRTTTTTETWCRWRFDSFLPPVSA